ncbi:HAAS signaling domain-containing protein [Dactylosporangium sp. CA-233914]|uniref:HAAS signaling domain-containing protein n=1 Tax=Dactylosporangium sp. CA-233914 TaxID=3239934 RepID=UPI003D8A3140
MTAPSSSSLEIDYYLERVREALADLPEDVRDDLVEDLPAHLAEVLQEQGGPLVERLGPPAAYAAELRAAAGVETRSAAARRSRIDLDKWRARLRTADEKTGRVLGYERATDFLRLLRPAWWVVRGITIVVVIFALDIVPIDRIDDPIGWAFMAIAVVASVRLGATGRPNLHRFVGYGITGVALIGALILATNLDGIVYRFTGTNTYTPVPYNPYSDVVDVYPVDQDGRPLEHVTLYDQDGNPISLGDAWRCSSSMNQEPPSTPSYPLCPLGRTKPTATPSVEPAVQGSASPSVQASPSPSG